MRVNQVVGSIAYGDAISDVVFLFQRIFRSEGFESEIYTAHSPKELRNLVRSIDDYAGDAENTLFIHHSYFEPRINKIIELPDKKIIVYHNVTPSHFFKHNPLMAVHLRIGRKQLKIYKDFIDFALANSEYSRRELEYSGFKQTDVLPIIPDFNKFKEVQPANDIISRFSNTINVLFVGRVVPHKLQEDVIKAFYLFNKYINPISRLFLVGGYDKDDSYYQFLVNLISDLDISDSVLLTGKVSLGELVAYYKIADMFLCMSEHEGFCVPLLESMYFDIPILAYKSSAIPYTLDKAGIMFDVKDFRIVAEIMQEIVENKDLREKLIMGQRERLKQFDALKVKQKLLEVIKLVRCI